MRTFGLSIAFIAAMTGVASAQDRPVNMLDFNHEPQGQEFIPPRFRIVRTDLDEQRVAERGRMANGIQSCAAIIADYGPYVAPSCLQRALDDEPSVVTVAKQLCVARVADTYSNRGRIYRACMEEELEPQGYTVLDPRNAQEMAAYYSVSTN